MANTFVSNKKKVILIKVYLLCADYRSKKGEKCPPWTIQASNVTRQ